MDHPARSREIVDIPLVDLGDKGALALVDAEPDRLRALFQSARSHYGDSLLRLGDAFSERWLERADAAFAHEIAAVAERARDLGVGDRGAGAYMLNLSYEWSCTAGVGVPPSGRGNRLLRTLDWPLRGLGRNVVVARMTGAAGDWFNVTWPGFVGAATAMAPGRFAAAINQPPMRRFTPSCWLDWAIERARIWRRDSMPPMHLLRLAFETCTDYAAARDLLTTTPIAMPALFTLSGVAAGESCIIERTETRAYLRESAGESIANHWVAAPEVEVGRGRSRGADSLGRLTQMDGCRDAVEGGFDWVAPPILNPTTRVAAAANASLGTLEVRGYEPDGPATRDFSLSG